MNRVSPYKTWLAMTGLLYITWINVAYATDTDLWREAGTKTAAIYHSDWQVILDTYLREDKEGELQPALNVFNYADVTASDKRLLKAYLDKLQAIDPREYSQKEQFAYWVNLYNALTVDLILDNYPVKSITKLGPLLSFGPWDEPAAVVAGESLSLNDIEHKILRPIWQDPRIHYAVNCASIGCPNLSMRVFTAENTEVLLERAARDYINHPRGVSLQGNRLKLSKIYQWYADDFGESEQDLLAHLAQYAKPALAQRLQSFTGKIGYDYDWSLNQP